MSEPNLSPLSPSLSVGRWFLAACARGGTRAALRHRSQGTWMPISWRQWAQNVREMAAGLLEAGLGPQERIVVLGEGDPVLATAMMAVCIAGGVCVPLSPRRPADELAAIVRSARVRAILIDPNLRSRQAIVPATVQQYVLGNPWHDGGRGAAGGGEAWADLMAAGRRRLAEDPQFMSQIEDRVGPDDPCMILHTGGTGRSPVGVVLSHRNLVFEAEALARAAELGDRDEQLLVLPLSQVLGQNMLWAGIAVGACTAFGRISTIRRDLVEVAPTVLAAVPHLLEVFAREFQGELGRGLLGRLAMPIGARVSALVQAGRAVPPTVRWQWAAADRYVLSGVRERLGGRLRFIACGGAPLRRELAEFFHRIGLLVLEGYGLTETAGVVTWNRPDRFRFGSVGAPLPGIEVVVAPDGEILVRGPQVMVGTLAGDGVEPAPLDQDGFFHTGDLGEWSGGCLLWRGRVSEAQAGRTGTSVAVERLEAQLGAAEGIAQAVVLRGVDGSLVALIAVDVPAALIWSEQEQLGCRGRDDLLEHPRIRARLGEQVAEANRLQPPVGRISRFVLLPESLTSETGELTALGTPRRGVIGDRYAHLMDRSWPVPGAP